MMKHNGPVVYDMGTIKKIPTLGDTVTCIYVVCIHIFIQILWYVRDKNCFFFSPFRALC